MNREDRSVAAKLIRSLRRTLIEEKVRSGVLIDTTYFLLTKIDKCSRILNQPAGEDSAAFTKEVLTCREIESLNEIVRDCLSMKFPDENEMYESLIRLYSMEYFLLRVINAKTGDQKAYWFSCLKGLAPPCDDTWAEGLESHPFTIPISHGGCPSCGKLLIVCQCTMAPIL